MSQHSISQTCYFVAPKGPARKRRRIHIEADRNAEAFHARQSVINKEVNSILNTENATLLDDIHSFVKEPRSQHKKMPCGLIVSGGDTNIDRLYSRLEDTLHNVEPSSVVFVDLSTSDCLNLKSALKRIVQTVISSRRAIKNKSRIQAYDVRLIEAWIQYQSLGNAAPPTIVIAIRHIESVSSSVLDELVDTLSVYSIDFRFLCNVSTSLHQLQDCLSAASIRNLNVHTFDVDHDESTLDKIVARLLIDNPIGLRLGFDTYYSLWSDYQSAQRSVDLFLSAFKFVEMCHHFTHKLAWVASSKDIRLSSTELEAVRSLPSFKLAASEAEHSTDLEHVRRVREALTDDSVMQALCESCLDAIEQHKIKLANAMHLLFIVRQNCQSIAKGKSQAEIYKMLLDRGLVGSSLVRELLLSVKVIGFETLLQILQQCASSLPYESDAKLFQELLDELQAIKVSTDTDSAGQTTEQRRLALGWKDAASREEQEERAKILHSEHELAEQKATRKTKYSRKTAGDAAKSNLSGRDKRYTDLVDSVHTQMTRIFQDLINHEHLTLHELYWFNNDKTHRAVFTPNIRQHLRAALTDPETFLGPTEVEPQTTALFRLFEDSGQLINLYDWLQAFKQVYSGGIPKDQREDGTTDSADVVEEAEDENEDEAMKQQALFTQSVAELKFMGFFKSTRRKTDHVQKTISML